MDHETEFNFSLLATSAEEFQAESKSGNSTKSRRFLVSLCKEMENIGNVSEGSQVLFCSFIPNYFRFVAAYPKFRKVIFQV
jgi:hypothetical protein